MTNQGYLPVLDRKSGTVLLTLQEGDIDIKELLDLAAAHSFKAKKEFHITIVGFGAGKKILESINTRSPQDQESLWKKIEEIIHATKWQFTLRKQYFHLSKKYFKGNQSDEESTENNTEPTETRESYIELADLPCLNSFYHELNQLLALGFSVPPAHVTLFIKNSNPEEKNGIGVSSMKEFWQLNPRPIFTDKEIKGTIFKKILLPTRAQPDTLAALALLRKYGEVLFPGIKNAVVDFLPLLPEGENEETSRAKGILLLDMGGGTYDHHKKAIETTLSDIIAEALGVKEDPSLAKLLEYARRDDMLGKGTISNDPLDRAFGLSGLLTALNKSHAKNPSKVVDIVLPLIEAHIEEEERRTKEMPLEFETKLKEGKAEVITVRQRDKKLKVVIIDSDNPSLPGYLRSQLGGRFDVVAQYLPSGHVNILTRPTKRVDLRALVALVRAEDMMLSEPNTSIDPHYLAKAGRIDEVPHWYYDTATNSLQNGGIDPKDIMPTKIPRFSFKKILELGLSESLWSPVRRN